MRARLRGNNVAGKAQKLRNLRPRHASVQPDADPVPLVHVVSRRYARIRFAQHMRQRRVALYVQSQFAPVSPAERAARNAKTDAEPLAVVLAAQHRYVRVAFKRVIAQGRSRTRPPCAATLPFRSVFPYVCTPFCHYTPSFRNNQRIRANSRTYKKSGTSIDFLIIVC